MLKAIHAQESKGSYSSCARIGKLSRIYFSTNAGVCQVIPEYSLIREMACVGDTLTPLVIAEIGDVRNFHSKHVLIAYAGIDAPPY